MPEDDKPESTDNLLDELKDDIFGDPKEEEESEQPAEEPKKTLPALIDQNTALEITKDVLKEKNQKKYELMGAELLFQPYWFFTYTCELVIKDKDGNIVDSEEIGGRQAIDAVTGQLADHLPEILKSEPIQTTQLDQEMGQFGEGARLITPQLKKEELQKFIQQKISGALRADKENVSVGGFEMVYSPVWKVWLSVNNRTHNVQICGTSGMGLNMDDMPLREKDWRDIMEDNINTLKDPKKWLPFLKRGVSKSMKVGAPKGGNMFLLVMFAAFLFLIYGLLERNILYIFTSCIAAVVIFWQMNKKKGPKITPEEAAYLAQLQQAQQTAGEAY